MKCLVTGSEGFVGKYLAELLQSQGHEIYTFDIKYSGEDIRNYEAVRRAIDDSRPDKIFHLAALAYIPESFLDPQRAIEINTVGSMNILEAVRRIGLKTKIHLCGTSEEYGDALGPLTEETALKPLSPYAIGKAGMDYFGQLYARSYNMNVVITRTFNHTGPERGEQYAEGSWAKQIAEIEAGLRTTLYHGDLSRIRNYTDVRDVVRAYALAIDLPSGVYNVCSNQNVTMEQVLHTLTSLSSSKIPTELDPNLLRPADFSFAVPDCSKFTNLTGWKPEIELEETLSEILTQWRDSLSS